MAKLDLNDRPPTEHEEQLTEYSEDSEGNLKIVIRYKCPNCSSVRTLELKSRLT